MTQLHGGGERDLAIATNYVAVRTASATETRLAGESSIVVNPTGQDISVDVVGVNVVPPLSSQWLRGVRVLPAELLIILDPTSVSDLRGIEASSGWMHHSEITQGARPDRTDPLPLWRSAQYEVGVVRLDVGAIPGQVNRGQREQDFLVRLSMWFAHAGTDCGIHNAHDFMEVHTQVAGTGRMQKFRSDDAAQLYQDEPMWPGYTTSIPYCTIGQPTSFDYPWHRYYAETDCLWMALEYYPS